MSHVSYSELRQNLARYLDEAILLFRCDQSGNCVREP